MNQYNFQLPAVINAGDSIKLLYGSPDYPATDGWALVFMLRNAAGHYDLTCEAQGSAHLIKQTPTQTSGFVAGNYAYRAQFIKDDEAITVAQGNVRINPSFGDGAVDARGDAKIAYDNVTAMIAGKGNSGVYEYEIRGRRLKSYTIPELLALQSHLKRELAQEDAANGISSENQFKGQIRVRFGNGY